MKNIKIFKNDKGSLTIESMILIIPVMIFLLLLISIIQVAYLQNCVNEALYETADILSDFAILYHENGIGVLNEELTEHIMSALNTFMPSSKILEDYDMSVFVNAGNSIPYMMLCEFIYTVILESDPMIQYKFVKISDISFNGSRFFVKGDDVILHISVKSDNLLFKLFGKNLYIRSSITFAGWLSGYTSGYSGIEGLVSSVWDLNNLARGQAIRHVFGGNLPQNHSVIAYYDSERGDIASIKSLDHTMDSYKDPQNFKKEIISMIDSISGYKNEEYKIINRKVILVMPQNKMSEGQLAVMIELYEYALRKQVELNVNLYQYKNCQKIY